MIIYLGSSYEYFDREESFQDFKEHDGIAYIRAGFDYPVAENMNLGVKVQSGLNDDNTDIITGNWTVRISF